MNRKGGCGKTGTTHQLSGAFAKMGLRVLLVDMDPQASLTQGFFGPEGTEAVPRGRSIVALFDDACDPDPDKILVPTPCAGITILPGANALDDFNTPRPTEAGPLQTALKSFLKEVEGRFDVILIDCPPNLHLCSWNALLAADFVMVPIQPEDFGAQGIVYVQRAIDLALQKYNPNLRMLGYLVTLRQKLALHEAYEQQLRLLYGAQVFEARLTQKKDFKEAISERVPIHFLRPRCAAAKEIHAIAEEIMLRVPAARSRPPEFLHFENRVNQENRKVAS
ncbi:MAG: ParA family protein [Actinomycetota bacterium]|nr:ParA family protein [Actinomycetota bacterium]